MLDPELSWLILTAASIGFLHTLAGPDHYAPFAAMGAARGWSAVKTCAVTLLCGGGHLVGSVLLGALGIWLGYTLGGLELIESARGEIAAWALLCFGLVYAAWGLRRAYRNKPHTHWHSHDGVVHTHKHTHHGDHTHVHDETAPISTKQTSKIPTPTKALAPWSIFIVFVLGPCEALIPVLMYPAATHSAGGVFAVVVAFGAATLATMTIMALILRYGLSKMRLDGLERYGHALAGGAISACGASMVFLGL